MTWRSPSPHVLSVVTAGIIGIGGAQIGAGGASAAPPNARTAAAKPLYVNTIPGGGATVRPRAIAVGNGQCTPYFYRLRWSRWGGATARATGRVTYREPDFDAGESCGSARPIVRQVTVTLSRRATCRGRRFYRVLRSTGTSRSFPLDCGNSQG